MLVQQSEVEERFRKIKIKKNSLSIVIRAIYFISVKIIAFVR